MSDFEEPFEVWTDEERALLESAADDRAGAGARAATLAALGLGSATMLGASTATVGATTSIAPAAKGAGVWLIVKWLSVVGLGMGAVAAGVYAVKRAPHAQRAAPAVIGSTRPPMAAQEPVLVAPPAIVEPPIEPAVASAAADAKAAPRGNAARAEPDLREEIAVIDQARAALSRGDPARALSVLSGYSRDYPRGTLGPEATLLKIQAWVALGDRTRARSVGRAFLAAHPKSPLAARVRSLMGDEAH
jgi:hypothetical protein